MQRLINESVEQVLLDEGLFSGVINGGKLGHDTDKAMDIDISPENNKYQKYNHSYLKPIKPI